MAKKRKKGKMPAALLKYWRDRRRKPRRSTATHYLVCASKAGQEIYYAGGEKFASRKTAKRFASRLDADAIAYLLRANYPVLKHWRVSVKPA